MYHSLYQVSIYIYRRRIKQDQWEKDLVPTVFWYQSWDTWSVLSRNMMSAWASLFLTVKKPTQNAYMHAHWWRWRRHDIWKCISAVSSISALSRHYIIAKSPTRIQMDAKTNTPRLLFVTVSIDKVALCRVDSLTCVCMRPCMHVLSSMCARARVCVSVSVYVYARTWIALDPPTPTPS